MGFRALLVTAMLVFGNSCALGNLDCASGSAGRETTISTHDDHDSEGGCTDRDGCDEHPSRSCAHGSICCSTWGPAAATTSLSSSSFAAVVLLPESPILTVSATETPAPVPIPAESPPPLVSFLRL